MPLILRMLKNTDDIYIYMWRKNYLIWKYTPVKIEDFKKRTLLDEQKWIQLTLADNTRKYMIICDNDIPIGAFSITDISYNDSSCEIHIYIGDPSKHGNGLGTKAVYLGISCVKHFLKLENIYLYVRNDHVAAIKMYEKLNFHFTGITKTIDNYNYLQYKHIIHKL